MAVTSGNSLSLSLSLKKRKPSNSFERNVLIRIFGPARENMMWIIKYNGKF
jgi:hypothetical protein